MDKRKLIIFPIFLTERWKKALLTIALVILFLVADGTKSYFVARHKVSNQANLRCSGIVFVGVWSVSFKFDGGSHPDSAARFFVTPILPLIIGEEYCT